MKNLVLILTAITFMAVSCKKDDSATPDNLKGLVKKFVYDDGEIVSFEYDDQRRLIKETSTDSEANNETTIITYEYNQNGKIAKANYSDNGTASSFDTFVWEGNVVTVIGNVDSDLEKKMVYEFGEDGKLTKYIQYLRNGSVQELSYYETYTWADGNIVKGLRYNAKDELTETTTYEYTIYPNISPYSATGFAPSYVSANAMKYSKSGSSYVSEKRISYTYADGSNLPESITETRLNNGLQSDVYSYDCEYY